MMDNVDLIYSTFTKASRKYVKKLFFFSFPSEVFGALNKIWLKQF